MVTINLNKINSLLDELKGLKIKEAVSLRKRLTKEKDKIITTKEPAPKSAKPTRESINEIRSAKQKRNWTYWKNVADISGEKVSDVRTQWTQRKKGFKVKIKDAIWQNPSG